MNHSELGEPFKEFRFKFLEPEEYQIALKFMEKHLYSSLEPVGYNDRCPEDWNNLLRAMMERRNNLSYIAVHIKSSKIAACRMIDIINKDHEHHEPLQFHHKSNLDILKLCAEICKKENLFVKHGITQYAEMFGLVVDPKFRKMGLATEMYSRDLHFLKNRRISIVKCGFISPYSRKAGLKHGYVEFARRNFHDCKNEYGEILNPASNPDGFICFGVFNLTKLNL